MTIAKLIATYEQASERARADNGRMDQHRDICIKAMNAIHAHVRACMTRAAEQKYGWAAAAAELAFFAAWKALRT